MLAAAQKRTLDDLRKQLVFTGGSVVGNSPPVMSAAVLVAVAQLGLWLRIDFAPGRGPWRVELAVEIGSEHVDLVARELAVVGVGETHDLRESLLIALDAYERAS